MTPKIQNGQNFGVNFLEGKFSAASAASQQLKLVERGAFTDVTMTGPNVTKCDKSVTKKPLMWQMKRYGEK